MSDIVKLLEAARKAEDLLNNDLLNDVFENLRLAYQMEWETTQPAEVQQRELIWAKVKALVDIEDELKTTLNNRILEKSDFLGEEDE